MNVDFRRLASRALPTVNEIFDTARRELDSLLREETGRTLSEFIKTGNIEHAIFMQWAAIRDLIFRRAIPNGEDGLLNAYLMSRGLERIEPETRITLTAKELADYTSLTRKWAWSLRQSVIPKRGKILEKVVRLATLDSLKEYFSSSKFADAVEVSLLDTSSEKGYSEMDSTVIISHGHKKAVLGLGIKRNIRERKDEAVDTRRRALGAGTHQAVWHVFLSDGDSGDLDAFRQIQPAEDGTVYTWTGLAEKIAKEGIKPISSLPQDLLTFARSRLSI